MIVVREITESSCQVYMQERLEDGPLKGHFEFPGGKVEPDESGAEASIREFNEEVGFLINEADRVRPLTTLTHEYPDRKVHLNAFTWFKRGVEIKGSGKWVDIDLDNSKPKLDKEFPEANTEIFKRLCGYIKSQKEVLDLLWAM